MEYAGSGDYREILIDRTVSYGGRPVVIPWIRLYSDGIETEMRMKYVQGESEPEIISAILICGGSQFRAVRSQVDYDEDRSVSIQRSYFRTEISPDDLEAMSIVLKGGLLNIYPQHVFSLSQGIQEDDVSVDIWDERRGENIRLYIDEIRFGRLSGRIKEASGIEDGELWGLSVHYEIDGDDPITVVFEVAGEWSQSAVDCRLPVYGAVPDGRGSHDLRRYAVNAGVVREPGQRGDIILKKVSVKLFDDKEFRLI